VEDLIDNTTEPENGIISTVLSIGALLLGALGVFNHLQNALDRIWDVDQEQRQGGVRGFVKDKLLSFSMILVVGFLLLVSLVISTALSVLDNYLAKLLPGLDILLQFLSIVLSFGVTTLLFMCIYKFLPHTTIQWRDVGVGAAVTSLLFTIGRTVLGLYLGNSATSSTYGAAGALVIILLWVYYSAQIILFGAEFTQVFTKRYGSQLDESHRSEPSTQTSQTLPQSANG
jgi:membrane protein